MVIGYSAEIKARETRLRVPLGSHVGSYAHPPGHSAWKPTLLADRGVAQHRPLRDPGVPGEPRGPAPIPRVHDDATGLVDREHNTSLNPDPMY